jgi:hypothetical protein
MLTWPRSSSMTRSTRNFSRKRCRLQRWNNVVVFGRKWAPTEHNKPSYSNHFGSLLHVTLAFTSTPMFQGERGLKCLSAAWNDRVGPCGSHCKMHATASVVPCSTSLRLHNDRLARLHTPNENFCLGNLISCRLLSLLTGRTSPFIRRNR